MNACLAFPLWCCLICSILHGQEPPVQVPAPAAINAVVEGQVINAATGAQESEGFDLTLASNGPAYELRRQSVDCSLSDSITMGGTA